MSKLYTTSQAADYLGIHEETLKYHIYNMGHIAADHKLGKTLVFTQDTLDAFRERHQAEGLTVSEAAAYLGLGESTIRYHVYTSKRLKPVGKRGLYNIFSKADLDALRESNRKQKKTD